VSLKCALDWPLLPWSPLHFMILIKQSINLIFLTWL